MIFCVLNLDMGEVPMSKPVPEGTGWRIAVTILAFFGALIGVVLWLFFYAQDLSVYQNIAIVVVIILGFVGAMGATWAAWGMKYGERWSDNSDSCAES